MMSSDIGVWEEQDWVALSSVGYDFQIRCLPPHFQEQVEDFERKEMGG